MEKERKLWRRASLLALCPMSFAFALTGCAGDNRVANDPLIGAPVPRPQGVASAQPTTPAATASTSLPPLPSPRSSGSTAALTAGQVQSLDPSHDLRIAGRDTAPAPGTWRGQGPGMTAVLSKPEPLSGPPARTDLAAAATQPAATVTGNTRTLTYEQAQAQLAARGAKWQRLESLADTGVWRFVCGIPNRQNPNISRNYEARAADPISALRAALEQMDKER